MPFPPFFPLFSSSSARESHFFGRCPPSPYSSTTTTSSMSTTARPVCPPSPGSPPLALPLLRRAFAIDALGGRGGGGAHARLAVGRRARDRQARGGAGDRKRINSLFIPFQSCDLPKDLPAEARGRSFPLPGYLSTLISTLPLFSEKYLICSRRRLPPAQVGPGRRRRRRGAGARPPPPPP